jgi:hypothetical protein
LTTVLDSYKSPPPRLLPLSLVQSPSSRKPLPSSLNSPSRPVQATRLCPFASPWSSSDRCPHRFIDTLNLRTSGPCLTTTALYPTPTGACPFSSKMPSDSRDDDLFFSERRTSPTLQFLNPTIDCRYDLISVLHKSVHPCPPLHVLRHRSLLPLGSGGGVHALA